MDAEGPLEPNTVGIAVSAVASKGYCQTCNKGSSGTEQVDTWDADQPVRSDQRHKR